MIAARSTQTRWCSSRHRYIRACCERAVVIATKCDKLSNAPLNEHISDIIKTLSLKGDDIIIPFSAVSGMGVEEFYGYIEEVLGVEI